MDPVHPNMATYEKLAVGITSHGLIGTPGCDTGMEGRGQISDIPEWQRASLSFRGKRPGGTTPTPTGENSRKGIDLLIAKWREPPSECPCDNTYDSRRVVYSSERTSTRPNPSCFNLLYGNVHA